MITISNLSVNVRLVGGNVGLSIIDGRAVDSFTFDTAYGAPIEALELIVNGEAAAKFDEETEIPEDDADEGCSERIGREITPEGLGITVGGTKWSLKRKC